MKSKVINMKCFEKNRKPIPFLEVWSRDDEEKWWIFVRNMVSLWERWTDKKMSTRHFTMGMICTTQHNHDILLKNEKQTWKYVKHASFDQYQHHPFNKLNKINSTHIQTTHFSNLNNNSKIKKSKVINMKCFKKNRKPIPFLEVWSRDDEENWWIFVRNTVSLWERDEWTRQWIVKMNEGKLIFFFF